MGFRIDPNHPGSVIRFFLFAETIVNLLEGAVFFFAPKYFLQMVLAEGTDIGPAHENLLRVFALTLTFFVTPLTGLVAANTPAGIEGRKLVYTGYAIIEFFGIPFFLYLSTIGPKKSGFDSEAIKFVAKQLIAPFVGRLVPLWRPEYFGKYILIDDEPKKRR